MLPVVFIELKANPIHKKDIKNLILLGIFGQASLAFIFWGIQYTSTIDTAIIGTFGPLLTIYGGYKFYNEKISHKTKVGIAIATIGTALVVLQPILESGLSGGEDIMLRLFGNFLIVAYTVFFTIYVLYSKVVMGRATKDMKSFLRHIHVEPMKKHYSPTLSTAITFYVGLAVIIPFAFLENAGYFGEVLNPVNLDTMAWLGILYMALISSIVAYIVYEWGIQHADISDGAIFGYLGPLFTLPFSYLMLGEIPSSLALIGATILTIGVFIAEKYKT